jgi:type II secretory ATPase GspE/PulE/Tfp pilus assembly ATPase PilB-like protein
MISDKFQHINITNAFKATGCEHCRHTGYRGRTTVAEILHVTPEIDDLILSSAPKHKMLEIAKTQSFRTIQEDALYKVAEGMISLDDARMSVILI